MNDLPTHSKTLDTADYALLEPEAGFLRDLARRLEGCTDFAHPHRLWEYALALRVLLRSGHSEVLDVGGGCGMFSAAATCCGATVTHLDHGDFRGMVQEQAQRVGREINVVTRDFMDFANQKEPTPRPVSFIACLSVIEHVEDYLAFFRKLLGLLTPRGVVVLTMDFHPSNQRCVDGHIRTYDAVSMLALNALARCDFRASSWLGIPDYSRFEPNVYDYTFASLVLRRMT